MDIGTIITNSITASATVALAILTYLYIREIRKQTQAHREEIRNQIKESVKPKLAIRINGKFDWEIENVGKGTAFDLKVNVCVSNQSEFQGYPLAPNEYFKLILDPFLFQKLHIKAVLHPDQATAGNQSFSIGISYRDIYNNLYKETINAPAEWSDDAHNAALFIDLPNARIPKFTIRLQD